jgi:cytochrome P450
MRFGEIETRTVATLILRRFRLDLIPGDKMTVRQMPTLGPRGGLDMVVRDRVVAATKARQPRSNPPMLGSKA